MTVAAMTAELSNDEYMRWGIYYGRLAQRAELQSLVGRSGR